MKSCLLSVLIVGVLSSAYAEEFSQTFENGQFNERSLRVIGTAEAMFRDPGGLRVAISKQSGSAANTGVSFLMQIAGDCSIEAAVEIVDLPQPGGGYGTGAALLLEDGVSQGASLQRVKMPNGKEHYIAHKFVRNAAGEYKHEAKTFPVAATSARLRMERRGSQLHYSVSEDNGQTFQKLTQLPFSLEPLKVAQVYAQAGGEPNTVEIHIKNLQVSGESFVRPGQKVPQRRGGLEWVLAVLFVAIPVVGGLVWWYRRRTA